MQNGRLRNKATVSGNADKNAESSGYVFRILRGGKVILDESATVDLKRVKSVVHEVRIMMCAVFLFFSLILLEPVRYI